MKRYCHECDLWYTPSWRSEEQAEANICTRCGSEDTSYSPNHRRFNTEVKYEPHCKVCFPYPVERESIPPEFKTALWFEQFTIGNRNSVFVHYKYKCTACGHTSWFYIKKEVPDGYVIPKELFNPCGNINFRYEETTL